MEHLRRIGWLSDVLSLEHQTPPNSNTFQSRLSSNEVITSHCLVISMPDICKRKSWRCCAVQSCLRLLHWCRRSPLLSCDVPAPFSEPSPSPSPKGSERLRLVLWQILVAHLQECLMQSLCKCSPSGQHPFWRLPGCPRFYTDSVGWKTEKLWNRCAEGRVNMERGC